MATKAKAKPLILANMNLILSSDLLVVVFGVISYIFFINLQPKKTKPNGVLPPGRTGWPLIGESINLISAGRDGVPERFVRERMKNYSPDVFKTSIAGEKVACLCGVAGHKFVFSNENKVLKAWWPPQITKVMLAKGSPVNDSKKLRDALSQFLRPEAIKYYVPIMNERMKIFMVENFVTNGQVFNAVPVFKELAFSVSSKLFLNSEDPALIAKLSTQFEMLMTGLFSVPINFPGTNFRRALKSAIQFRAEISPLIKQRRSEPRTNNTDDKHDLLSYLISASADQPDTDDETVLKGIIDTILTVLMASHDTTSCVMSAVVYFLADHPHVYKQVLEEQIEIKKRKQEGELLNWDDVTKMKYSRNVINEVMRLVPPGAGAFKEAITDITHAGFTIPKGWKIYWTVHSTHKDPKYFKNPEEFDPSRFEGTGPLPYSYVPFGLGPRMCPGSEFARTEVLVFMHNLVTRFGFEKLVHKEKFIYDPLPLPAQGLPIRLIPHDNYGN